MTFCILLKGVSDYRNCSRSNWNSYKTAVVIPTINILIGTTLIVVIVAIFAITVVPNTAIREIGTAENSSKCRGTGGGRS